MCQPKVIHIILLTCWCMICGCAAFVTKPQTPADDITPRQAAAIAAPPGERYFILVFGSQSTPKVPKYTHSWATVVRVADGDGQGVRPLEERTISWMPASLDIRPLSFHVEQGINLDLNFTIEEMLRHDERVSLWGPYEVGPGLFYRFSVQKGFLESGKIGYQCIDSTGEAARCGNGCNCIHAITDMDPQFDRSQYPLSYFGEAASLNFVRQIQIRPIIIQPEMDHSWLLPMLGLDKYPITSRNYCGRTLPNTPENVQRYLQRHDCQ